MAYWLKACGCHPLNDTVINLCVNKSVLLALHYLIAFKLETLSVICITTASGNCLMLSARVSTAYDGGGGGHSTFEVTGVLG